MHDEQLIAQLSTLLTKNPKRLLVADRSQGVMADSMCLLVAEKQQALQTNNVKNCLISRLDTVDFISDFLACVYSGVNIVFPPNAQKKTHEYMKNFTDGVLGDSPNALEVQSPVSVVNINPRDVLITLFTSGSTGQPKPITRNLSCLLAEAKTLEFLWGDKANGSTILSTVSHQHIYGLLFKVLWPLCYGHTIWRYTVPFEENLHHLSDRFSSSLLVSSPAFLTRLSEKSDYPDRALRCVFSSGGALDLAQAQQVESILNTTCIRVFGSTETGGVAYQYSDTNEWTTFPRVKLLKKNKAWQISSPYCYQQPWFTLSDKVKIVNHERFLLLGRLDDVVKIEEKRVVLSEVEYRLTQHPRVLEAKVLVLPTKRRCLGAILVLDDLGKQEQEKSPRGFSQMLSEFLSDYFERVTLPKYYRYLSEFPINDQGKVSHAELLSLFDL